MALLRSRMLEPMRLPRIFADEHGHLTLLIATGEPGAKQPVVHPELAGFFLGKSVGADATLVNPNWIRSTVKLNFFLQALRLGSAPRRNDLGQRMHTKLSHGLCTSGPRRAC